MNKRGLYDRFHKGSTGTGRVTDERNFTYRIILSVINQFIDLPQKKILDIGCGVGAVDLYLASKGHTVHGIDIAENAIVSARRSAQTLYLDNATFAHMVFPSDTPKGKWDMILCMEVLEHLEDDKKAVRKIYELLTKDGIAIFSVPSKNAPLYRLGMANTFDKRVGHLRRYYQEDLVKICREVGFEVIEAKKAEGVLRNFLFLNPIAGKSLRFIKYFLADLITFFDSLSLMFFGESQIFVIAKKP